MAPAFKVLAVDGGGIRGIIPALVLAAIEEQTHRQIFELFDLVAGTSTGGIIALGVTKPGPGGADKAEKTAKTWSSCTSTRVKRSFLPLSCRGST